MACKHERIRCTNCVKYCLDCGVELPNGYVPGKPDTAPETEQKTAKTGGRRATGKKVTK